MIFESFNTALTAYFAAVFVLAVILGAVVNKTNFCTMGAVSDVVNMQDWGRMRAWFLAILVAMLGVILFEAAGLIDLSSTQPPYRRAQFPVVEYILGGLIFGIGMTLASGCGNKTLIRVGGGNIKSILVMVVLGIVAYYTINPIPGTEHNLRGLLVWWWSSPLAIEFSVAQDVGHVLAGPDNATGVRLMIGLALVAGVGWWIFRSAEFRSNRDNIVAGVVIGLCIALAWLVTDNIRLQDSWGDEHSLPGYVQEWDFVTDGEEAFRPASAGGVNTQSFTFIGPIAQTINYLARGADNAYLTFGVVSVSGVILGSLLWALLSRSFRVEWFVNGRDVLNHLVGAALMGFGGVMAMGCTIGQGVTGLSTLALSGFFTLGSIILGSALTMKIQYYKMLYDEEATFAKALITGLVDMKLLPGSLRKLEAL
ncbi:YeeE/YedE family protein [Alkalilimnicola ehrlichii MLHE-1]|uniref:Uncharacterized protein n=1 Tax=Alkalilimnicola ehrlichii (strain ATCC BAA-1101 / DSM 17681 / MLHE-1) TaxID=187272 RepID=Q0A824_ALKEH|nr:YeeE/YedE family protein [Alkalilimnicola ehrlichii]ABI57013.1 protein of unknown function DUF395, YeeE/YedE [Alkalilimnicola ehrlichii MLHE-1]